MKRWIFPLLTVLLIAACGGTEAPRQDTIGPTGSIGFWFYVDKDYYNGVEPQGDLVNLVESAGLFTVLLDTPSVQAAAAQAEFGAKEGSAKKEGKKPPSSVVNFEWQWLMEGGNRLNLYLPLLPGGSWYYAAFRWDSTNGMFDGFLNGYPLRVSGTKVKPWTLTEQAVNPVSGDNVEGLEISGDIWSDGDIKQRVQRSEHGVIGDLMGYGDTPALGGVDALKGKLLYAADFTNKKEMAGWTMEGPGVYEVDAEGWMTMESTEIDQGGPGDGHFVFWTPGIQPENFVAEWDFQAMSDMGLCIAIFTAMGQKGENIFDPSLKPRDGHFGGYIRGDINCYHISYYANIPTNPGRIVSNLRKNHGFYLVSNGPPGVPGGSKDVHKVTLVKNNGNIKLGVDGKTIIDWQDDGKKYGPVHGKGSLALRQMKWMKARYRNFKIWEVN